MASDLATAAAPEPDTERPQIPPATLPLVVEEPEASTAAKDAPVSSMSQTKRVSFHEIHFHEFPVILGDHPATSSGLPVTLDWDATKSYQVPVNQYEAEVTRRAGMELRMPPDVRRDLLHRMSSDGVAGAALQPDEVRRVAQGIRRIKGQRAHSLAMQEFEGVQVFVESACRKWRRWRNRRNDAVPDDPAAVWLEQWRQQKKQQASMSEHGTSTSASKNKLDVQICSMSLPGDILHTKSADVDSSESTRTSATTTSTIQTVASAPELSGLVIEHAVITASEDADFEF